MSHTARSIDLPCTLEISGYAPIAGRTRELSAQEAVLQCPSLVVPGIRKPVAGGTGVLTLAVRGSGAGREAVKLPCRVAYVSFSVVGLQLNTQTLDAHRQEIFATLLKPQS